MATSPKNRITRSVSPKSVYESAINVIDATVSFNQGDILCLDSGLLKAVTADADGATVLGVAQSTILLGKVVGPYSWPRNLGRASNRGYCRTRLRRHCENET